MRRISLLLITALCAAGSALATELPAAQDSTSDYSQADSLTAAYASAADTRVPVYNIGFEPSPEMTERLSIERSSDLQLAPWPDTLSLTWLPDKRKYVPTSIYALPYSITRSNPNWHRMWINTTVLSSAFVGTLVVLECLPEDATNWNRASIQRVPPLRRWYHNVFERNPDIDGDNAIFNYVLHPYAGAAYFMAARSQGFNFYQSLLYSSIISNIGWEFGIEAFMERPSYQDLIITPVVGSVLGEMFYRVKRHIVNHDYTLAGSPLLGNIVAFLVDPVNEAVDLFRGNYARDYAHRHRTRSGQYVDRGVESSLMPTLVPGGAGFAFSCRF